MNFNYKILILLIILFIIFVILIKNQDNFYDTEKLDVKIAINERSYDKHKKINFLCYRHFNSLVKLFN